MSAQPPFSGIPYPQPPFPAYPGGPGARPRRRRAWLVGMAAAVVTGVIGGVAGYQVGLHHSQIKAANAYVRATSSGCPAGQPTPAPSVTSPAGSALLARLLGNRGNVSMIIHVFVPARLNQSVAVQVLKAQYARLAS